MILVLPFTAPLPPEAVVVDTTSRSRNWSRGLSPFILGPVTLWGGHVAKNVENAWQYSKVYSEHIQIVRSTAPGVYHKVLVDLSKWLPWATAGWANVRAVRYPMAKGRQPLFSYWDGSQFDYIDARKGMYLPFYWYAVKDTEAFARLTALAMESKLLVLRDFDAYDHRALGMTLEDVLNNPGRKMGHAFVLAMMLRQLGIE